jgi:ribosomal protein S18 acetylase RimI-like enzyme
VSDDLRLANTTADDEKFLLAVYAATRREEMVAWGWSQTQQDGFLRMQFMARRSSYCARFPHAAVSLICRGETPVGALIVAREPDAIVLVDIAILPEHQRRGIGGGLLAELRAEGSRTAKPVRLSVVRENPAIRLYARSGFSIIKEDEVYLMMECQPGQQ